jgi:hypothetical protein
VTHHVALALEAISGIASRVGILQVDFSKNSISQATLGAIEREPFRCRQSTIT